MSNNGSIVERRDPCRGVIRATKFKAEFSCESDVSGDAEESPVRYRYQETTS
jgi:hypothetical protein